MNSTTIEAMHEQVRVIYRAATGSQLYDPADSAEPQQLIEGDEHEIEQRFAALEALARNNPELTRRIPPFSFTPLVDVLEGQHELLIEVAVPGIEASDVSVEVQGELLLVHGVRRGACGSNGRTFVRAQIPRGPFQAVIALPCSILTPARVEVERGIISIQLAKA